MYFVRLCEMYSDSNANVTQFNIRRMVIMVMMVVVLVVVVVVVYVDNKIAVMVR